MSYSQCLYKNHIRPELHSECHSIHEHQWSLQKILPPLWHRVESWTAVPSAAHTDTLPFFEGEILSKAELLEYVENMGPLSSSLSDLDPSATQRQANWILPITHSAHMRLYGGVTEWSIFSCKQSFTTYRCQLQIDYKSTGFSPIHVPDSGKRPATTGDICHYNLWVQSYKWYRMFYMLPSANDK